MTQFNDGKAPTFQASLLKSFVSVTLEDCQKAKDALGETFPGYSAYANKLAYFASKKIVDTPYGKYVRYRTHDGRLFHVEARERTSRNGDKYNSFKRGEVTSSMLISPEALAMKKAGVKILDFIRSNPDLPIKLNSFTHDDFSGEDLTDDKVFVKFAYNAIATEFHTITGSEANSGMLLGDQYALKTVINNYSEK